VAATNGAKTARYDDEAAAAAAAAAAVAGRRCGHLLQHRDQRRIAPNNTENELLFRAQARTSYSRSVGDVTSRDIAADTRRTVSAI